MEPISAVILAGGQGTRLRPLTYDRPKPVVPLLNIPFLAYQLALLRQHGVLDIVLSCSYMVEEVRRTMGDGSDHGVGLRYAVEAEPLGTGGGVRNAVDLVGGLVVVLNGDILTDLDLGTMLAHHAARRAAASIYLTRVPDPSAYGLVELEPDDRVRRFVEKPDPAQVTANTINAGVYVLERRLLERIPTGRPVSIEREFFPALVADGVPFFGWAPHHYWLDIGSPAKYRQGQMDLLAGRLSTPVTPPGRDHDGRWIAEDVTVDPGAEVCGPAVIAGGVHLRPGCRVGPAAVLGRGCAIGASARVEGAVLWEQVTVGEGARLSDCVVGAGATIGPGAVVEAEAVIEPGGRVAASARRTG